MCPCAHQLSHYFRCTHVSKSRHDVHQYCQCYQTLDLSAFFLLFHGMSPSSILSTMCFSFILMTWPHHLWHCRDDMATPLPSFFDCIVELKLILISLPVQSLEPVSLWQTHLKTWALTLALFFQEVIAQVSLPTNVLAAASMQHQGPGWMRQLKCSICDKHFSTLHGLELHQDLHRGRYPYHCQFCGKGCLSTTNLRRHIVKHTGVRDHKCTLCAKEFSCPWSLKRHINTHKNGWVIDASVMECFILEWTKLVCTPAPGTLFVIHSLTLSTSRQT